MKALLCVLCVALAAPAAAQDAGLPVPPADVALPGKSVELAEGAAAPFAGNLSDKARWAHVRAKREAAEAERDVLKVNLGTAQADRDAADRRAQQAEGRPSWGVVFGATGTALVVGIVAGVALALASK